MSRTGKKPVAIPAGVTATLEGGLVSVKGPKGALTLPMAEEVIYALADGSLSVNAQGRKLKLQLGYSHDVDLELPDGLEVKTPDQTTVEISGIDAQKVGQFAAEIRRWRKPEPYKGKGIKYRGEYIFRKEGKKK